MTNVVDLKVIKSDKQEEADEDYPAGQVFCTECNCHSFKLRITEDRQPYDVICNNCSNTMPVMWFVADRGDYEDL